MIIKPEKYIRKPFEVEAVEVTEENMSEVAQWCGGEVTIDPEGPRSDQKFVKVPVKKPLSERQTRAYAGDWVLLALTSDRDAGPAGFKVYTPKAFVGSFQRQVDEMFEVVGRMDQRVAIEEKLETQEEALFPTSVRP